jgi:hypothetical protein
MGEKISTLGYIRLAGIEHEVELNHPPSDDLPRQIHIQTEKSRIEFNEDEFVLAVLAINLAAEKLRYLKKIK